MFKTPFNKQNITNRYVIFVLMFSVFSLQVLAQKKQETKSAICQIASVHRDSVLVNLKEYPVQVKILEAFQKQLQSEFEFKQLELDAKVKEYQEKEKTFTEAQKQEKTQELQNSENELKKFKQEAQQKLQQKEKELLQPMNEKINKAIEAVALKKAYTQIIDRKFTYFSLPACDATQLVIEEANR
jgi:outer membrane protein